MAQQFTTAPNSPNPYVTYTLNNMNLVKTMNQERKDWTKKYHKIIWEIRRMVYIQMQLQNIIKLTEEANTQITEIKSTILQASNNYQTQMAGVLWDAWTLTIFFSFLLFFWFYIDFLFLFLLFCFWTMKRHMTLQSHDMSHDVRS